MKLLLALFNRNRFLLFMSVCALVFVQQSNAMMQSKKHRDILFNRSQALQAKHMKAPVWVKTSDNDVVALEQWKIDQMKLLQVILEDQNGANSRQNPIVKPKVYKNDQWITFQELQLLSSALDDASVGQFEEFYKDNEAVLRLLINAAQKVEATGISALCGTYFFPKDMQQLVVKDMMQPVVEYIKRNNIQIKETPLAGNQTTIRSVAFSHDGTKIASGSWSGDCGVVIFDAQTGNVIHKLLPSASKVVSVAFSHDNTKLVAGCYGADNKLIVWDVQTGEVLLTIAPDGNVRAVAFSADDTKIISGCLGSNTSLTAWDAKDGTKVWETVGYGGTINSIVLSQDGTKIISGAMGNQDNLMMWNADDGRLLHNFIGIPSNVYSVALSSDETKLVCGISSDQDNIIVLDIATGNQLYSVKGGSHMVLSLAFSSDGVHMVSGGEEGSLILWNVLPSEYIEKVANLIGHTKNVLSVAFSPDGMQIVSGGSQLLRWEFLIDLIKEIENNLTLEQARLLYQMYCAAERGESMILKKDTIEYKIYETFSDVAKREICRVFHVMLEECTIEELQENGACCIS